MIKKRYEALDAWRGLSACILVFFHFFNVIKSHLNQFDFIQNAFVFVDFFFVLSGFVIAANYQEKLLKGLPVKDYIFLRLGRIYPLHIVILLFFVTIELSKLFLGAHNAPFTEPNDIPLLISSLFLTQSLGFHDHLGWSIAAWSISVEFYTYILYACAAKALGNRIWIAGAISVIILPFILLALGKPNIGITYDYGILRCIYGFSAGMLTYNLLKKFEASPNINYTLAGCIETLIIFVTVLFIGTFGREKLSLISPYLFALMIAIFAQEKGFISRLLTKKPFMLIGTLSYSIYLFHPLVENIIFNSAKLIERIFHYRLLEWADVRGRHVEVIKGGLFMGDFVQFSALAITIVGSYITYKIIEVPCNRWVRRYIQKKDHVNVPQGESAAF